MEVYRAKPLESTARLSGKELLKMTYKAFNKMVIKTRIDRAFIVRCISVNYSVDLLTNFMFYRTSLI